MLAYALRTALAATAAAHAGPPTLTPLVGAGLVQHVSAGLLGRSLVPMAAAALHSSSIISSAAAAAATAPFGDHEARILVTGACGQIGTEFTPYLRFRVGAENVLATDVRTTDTMRLSGPFAYLDVTDRDALQAILVEKGITHVVHLASLLSASGEHNPALALKVNTQGVQNVLDLAVKHRFAVFAPSTIAVFGPSTPRIMTPDDTILQPVTMYGITKVHQELLGAYYARRYGVDYRSLRYPGVISSTAPPGGGTTDYAVDIFHGALRDGTYNCFLAPDTPLPMMCMKDCLEATWRLMTAPRELLSRTTYNVTACSFTPEELADSIRTHLPTFNVKYAPDFRDGIARSWPASIDDSLARRDWAWSHAYGMHAIVEDMLRHLSPQYGAWRPTTGSASAEVISQHPSAVAAGSRI